MLYGGGGEQTNDWDMMNKIPPDQGELLGGKILLPWPWVSPEKLLSHPREENLK